MDGKKTLIATIGIIILLLCTRSIWREAIVARKGSVVQAEVIHVPGFCWNRNNRIDVGINGKKLSLPISREECVNRVFQPGNTVKVKYHPDYGIVLRTEHDPEGFLYGMLFVGIVIATFASAHMYWKWRESVAKKAMGLQPAKRISPRQRRKMRRKNL